MKNVNKSWVIFTVFFVVVCWMPSAQQSIGAPVPGGPGFVSFTSNEFKPLLPGTTFDFKNGRIYNTSNTEEHFVAPLHLPHGVTITQLVLYFVENSISGHIGFYLWTNPLESPIDGKHMVYAETSGLSPDPKTLIANTFPYGNTIDNQSNSYFVGVILPPGDSYLVGGARVDYGFSVNLPLVVK